MVLFQTDIILVIAFIFLILQNTQSSDLKKDLSEDAHYLSEHLIDVVNSEHTTWTAGKNFPRNTLYENLDKLLGTIKDVNLKQKLSEMEEYKRDYLKTLPDTYDPREVWRNCSSLEEIREQGACGSCWAVSAVATMTDRYCIHSEGKRNFHFSAEDLMNCCEVCGLGCTGGYHVEAWKYFNTRGIVSGGNYNTSEGCKPYTVPPSHYDLSDSPPFLQTFDISQCVTNCKGSYGVSYYNDKRIGKRPYYIPAKESQIRAELMKNGPVEGVMDVYEDFFHYKKGVYKHVGGFKWGYHAVKLMGWGIENGAKYWLAANSWGHNWGENGFFKILRGKDHCHIESYNVAAIPVIIEEILSSGEKKA